MDKKKSIFLGCGVLGLIVLCGGAIAILAKFPTAATAPRTGNVETIVGMKTTDPKPITTTAAKRPPETKSVPAPEQFSKDKVPSEALLRKLTTDTLLDMDQAIKSKDFKAFHGKVAKQAQSTPEAMKNNFGAFNADLSGVKDVAPTFAPAPTIDKDGHLVVQGMYPSKPNRVTFEFRYVFEPPEWRLLRHNLSTSSN